MYPHYIDFFFKLVNHFYCGFLSVQMEDIKLSQSGVVSTDPFLNVLCVAFKM